MWYAMQDSVGKYPPVYDVGPRSLTIKRLHGLPWANGELGILLPHRLRDEAVVSGREPCW